MTVAASASDTPTGVVHHYLGLHQPHPALCRQHHRMKTHHGWRYHRIRAGVYRWHSPHGYEYVVSPAGTIDVSNDLDPPIALVA